ncbi:MAG: UDP-N-acetylglucosamine 2-epimerase (non-hydrolyzing) [Pirellulales bacterium]
MSPRIAVIVGTRPEVIKLAPVYRALLDSSRFEVSLVSTGQHREMSRQALDVFELKSDVELDLMSEGQTLESFASRALFGLSSLFSTANLDCVVVQGDTTTTLMASLAAFYQKIPVAHVEAGMRTGNIQSPWPEEMNRRLTADLASWHFVPVRKNIENLTREGISKERCYVTGNTVLDSLLWIRNRLQKATIDHQSMMQRLNVESYFYQKYILQAYRFLLVTCHRRESHGQGIDEVCQALKKLANDFPDLGIFFPVHPNPEVIRVVHRELANLPQIALCPPLDYEDFVWIMDKAFAIISDSGGIQGEAMTLGKPVLVTRDTTEYPEAIDCGGCQLVGTKPESICSVASKLLVDHDEYRRRSNVVNPYGDGRASEKILQILSSELGRN